MIGALLRVYYNTSVTLRLQRPNPNVLIWSRGLLVQSTEICHVDHSEMAGVSFNSLDTFRLVHGSTDLKDPPRRQVRPL